jgi:uncharacterized protein YjbI with pentapeptide repeats
MATPDPPARPDPAAPRLGALEPTDRTDLVSEDVWIGEQVADVDLHGRVADHVEIAASELVRVELTGTGLERLRLVDVVVRDCELSGALAGGASIVRAEFHRCRMTGLELSGSKLAHVRFVDCKLDEANLRFVEAEQVVFERCSLVGTEFYGATLATTEFDTCDLTRGQFSKATVAGARFAGSTIDGLRGAGGMSGVVIAAEQVLPLALSVFRDLGIVVEHLDDDHDPAG